MSVTRLKLDLLTMRDHTPETCQCPDAKCRVLSKAVELIDLLLDEITDHDKNCNPECYSLEADLEPKIKKLGLKGALDP